VKRAVRESLDDHIPNIAAALAYYAFLAIPAALMVSLGLFSVLADQDAIQSVVDKLGSVMPSQATDLIENSPTRKSENRICRDFRRRRESNPRNVSADDPNATPDLPRRN
jgi:uncharacterized BrkB/YihY/UPF0761 family membrane protein